MNQVLLINLASSEGVDARELRLMLNIMRIRKSETNTDADAKSNSIRTQALMFVSNPANTAVHRRKPPSPPPPPSEVIVFRELPQSLRGWNHTRINNYTYNKFHIRMYIDAYARTYTYA